jgi:hypothetical protein
MPFCIQRFSFLFVKRQMKYANKNKNDEAPTTELVFSDKKYFMKSSCQYIDFKNYIF